jgi:hypothetical protein
LGAFGASGCFIETSDPGPPPVVVEPGRLIVRWLVTESNDPNLCVVAKVAAIDITVHTTSGEPAGEYQSSCENFATTISSLYPGNYVAEAVLIDSSGRPRTTIVDLRPFTIVDRTDLVIDVDFPADSFLDALTREALPEDGGPPASAAPSGSNETSSVAPGEAQPARPTDAEGATPQLFVAPPAQQEN